MENRTKNFCSIPLLFFQRFDYGAALKIERKMSHLNIAFDRFASMGAVMHYILVISCRDGVETLQSAHIEKCFKMLQMLRY